MEDIQRRLVEAKEQLAKLEAGLFGHFGPRSERGEFCVSRNEGTEMRETEAASYIQTKEFTPGVEGNRGSLRVRNL